MEDDFNEKLVKMLNEEVYIPQRVTNRIKTSLNEERKRGNFSMRLNKTVATMLGIIVIGTGVVFGTKAYIENKNSVDVARDHGYFEKVDSDYIINDGLGIKIEDYFIDQARIGVTLNVKCDEEMNPIQLYNTKIASDDTYFETRDGKTYIHWDESEIGLEYRKRFELIKFIDENGNEVRYKEDSIGGRGPEFDYEDLGNNVVRIKYTVPIYEEVSVNKMKVVIKRVVTTKEGTQKEHIGDWVFEINIADKYLKSPKSIKYNGTVNLENITVERADLGATKLIVTIKTDDLKKLLYGTQDSKEELYGGVKLFGQKGEYNFQQINSEQSNYYDKNEITFKFDLSKFEADDFYEIVMPANYEGNKDIVITLNK